MIAEIYSLLPVVAPDQETNVCVAVFKSSAENALRLVSSNVSFYASPLYAAVAEKLSGFPPSAADVKRTEDALK